MEHRYPNTATTRLLMSQLSQDSAVGHGANASVPAMAANSAVDWERRCQELTAERDRLQKEMAEVKDDRDAYLKAVNLLLPEKECSYTKEEILAQVCHNPSFDDLITELEIEL